MRRFAIPVLLLAMGGTAGAQGTAPRLKVSENRRFLVTTEGKPFFWLGDTAWELFNRLDRDAAARYLDNRKKLGFTVIQAVAIAEFDGHTVPNRLWPISP